MDVVSYAKAKAVDDRLTQALAAGNNPSGWMADRDAINAKLADQNKQSQTIENGLSVINGTLDSPVDVQVKGRTLISMGSSVLQNGKQFVLADKKTKIRTLGSKSAQTQGVAKFVQTVPTTDTANFVGKTAGSTAENPHIYKFGSSSAFLPPSSFTQEQQSHTDNIKVLDGTKSNIVYSTNAQFTQTLFSFNVIAEIENQIGRIPKATLADKVQWCKDNITSVNCNWYGYGSGPAGNKAYLVLFRADSQAYSSPISHTNGTITKLGYGNNSGSIFLQSDGFAHFMAYADASDGITASVINTDYVELVIVLNATAQLDNRPILSRITNFDGKVMGSTVEVPHIGYRNAGGANSTNLNALVTPSNFASYLGELRSTSDYTAISKNDGSIMGTSAIGSGNISQMVFSFDIIQEIERQLGRIPKATLADKVQWCKDNVLSINCDWYGYGSGPNGYKAYLSRWRTGTNGWYSPSYTMTASSPTHLGWSTSGVSDVIDTNGLISYIVYADAAALVANPTVAPTVTASGSGGGLAAGTYYVTYTWFNANGETMVSPETNITITAGQTINVTVPTLPFGITQANVYIGTTSGAGYRQGNTGLGTTFTLSSALLTNTTPVSSRTSNSAIVASAINTDYIEFQFDLAQGATLHDPVVPLYQVDDNTHYANILTVWNEAEVLNRYPKVQGVQHLQNVYVQAEGENLIPPLTEWLVLHANAVVTSPYFLTLNATANAQVSYVDVNVRPSQAYTISMDAPALNSFLKIEIFDANGTRISNPKDNAYTTPYTFTTDATAAKVRITVYGYNGAGTYTFANFIMTVGSTAKPFEPRNPSYLFATNKLGQIGTVQDALYKQDGQWYIRKVMEKDMVLDGSLSWSQGMDYTGFKYFNAAVPNAINDKAALVKYNGKNIQYVNTWANGDLFQVYGNIVRVAVDDSETGFGEIYNPTAQEQSAFFYGWQAKTVDANGKPTAWRSLGDGTDAPTQTLAYVSANKAPNYTPYKLSYVLATPVVIPTTVEGDIALNGPTQVQVGSGVIVREKAVPSYESGTTTYHINLYGHPTIPNSPLKYRLDKFIAIYKNGIDDTKNWSFDSLSYGYGKTRAFIKATGYDATAEYTVTYILFTTDNTKAAFTNNALEVITNYDTSLKSVVDSLVEKQSDLITSTGINVQAIAELYKRVKALGG